MKKKDADKIKKDNTYAWIAFILLLFFWAPFINIILFILSIYFSVKQLKLNNSDSAKYGAFWFSIMILILSLILLFLTALIFYLVFYYDIKLY